MNIYAAVLTCSPGCCQFAILQTGLRLAVAADVASCSGAISCAGACVFIPHLVLWSENNYFPPLNDTVYSVIVRALPEWWNGRHEGLKILC